MNFIKVVFLLSTLLYALQSQAECYEDVDKFSEVKRQWCGVWGTGGTMLGSLMGVDPIPYKVIQNDGTSLLFIKMVIESDKWLFIQQNGRLIFILDNGEKITLTTPDGSVSQRDVKNDKISGVQISETAFFPVTKDIMEKLSKASKVDFAIYGDKGRAERTLKKEQLDYYTEFLKKYGG